MTSAASFQVSGAPAIIIILIILALIVTGIYTVIKKGQDKAQGK